METSDKSSLESFLEQALAKNKSKFNLDKLSTIKLTSNIVKEVRLRIFILVAFILFLVVISIAMGYWINTIMKNPYYGFYIVSSFYFITALIASLVLHRWVDKSLMQVIISKILT